MFTGSYKWSCLCGCEREDHSAKLLTPYMIGVWLIYISNVYAFGIDSAQSSLWCDYSVKCAASSSTSREDRHGFVCSLYESLVCIDTRHTYCIELGVTESVWTLQWAVTSTQPGCKQSGRSNVFFDGAQQNYVCK